MSLWRITTPIFYFLSFGLLTNDLIPSLVQHQLQYAYNTNEDLNCHAMLHASVTIFSLFVCVKRKALHGGSDPDFYCLYIQRVIFYINA